MNKVLKYFLYGNVIILVLLVGLNVIAYLKAKKNGKIPGVVEVKTEKIYALSPINPVEVGKELTDTIHYTFESPTIEKWVFFDFSRGGVVSDVTSFKDPLSWDLAFRRAKIVSNGGNTNKKGKVAVSKLKTTDFDIVTKVPENVEFIKDNKPPNKFDPQNTNLEKWYSYNFLNHKLKSHSSVFIIKTAEGNYAKMQILNYYCEKEEKKISSCYTIKYVYQGNGSESFVNYASKSLK